MSDDLVMVDSRVLREVAPKLKERDQVRKLVNGVPVTGQQLEAAAKLLEDGPRSEITSIRGGFSGTVKGGPQELGGYIHASRQDDPEVLVFDVGILSGLSYRIARDGTVTENRPTAFAPNREQAEK